MNQQKNKIVVIIGGAVSGSEAVHQFIQRGIGCVVIEQNPLPYGKIEDGLPKWHEKQRRKEMDLIDSRIAHELVDYIPHTELGKDLSFDELYSLRWSAIVLANGAWKDRPFPIEKIEKFDENGFYYQNPFVHWFNHYRNERYDGENLNVLDNSVVVGGGLASIDVVKILQLEVVVSEMEKRSITVDIIEMERKGIPVYLNLFGVKYKDLNIKGCTLTYRRDIANMPLVVMPENLLPEKAEKIRATRQKILSNMQNRYLFNVLDRAMPVDILVENERLTGLKMIKTEIVHGEAVNISGTEFDLKASTVISSIGSIPVFIEGIPMQKRRYHINSEFAGRIEGLNNVYAIGNAVTGKGNIKASRINAIENVSTIAEKFLPGKNADAGSIEKWVREKQSEVGYDGNYWGWKKKYR